MTKYVIKRILLIIPTILIVSLVLFFMLSFANSDPGRTILGDYATQEEVDQKNHELGVDRPVIVQWFNYFKQIVTKGSFGQSWFLKKETTETISAAFPVSLQLSTYVMLLCLIVGVPIGIISAVKQYSFIDNFSRIANMLLSAMPSFLIALILLIFFSLKLGWLPTTGSASFKYFILPTIAMGLPHTATMQRLTRSSMLETIRADYVRTAKAKGAPNGQVIFKHALRNALLPIITQAGILFSTCIGGGVVTEKVFAMNGLGQTMVAAVQSRDVPIIITCCLLISAIYCLVMLIVDVLYAFVDPRIKAKYSSR